MLDQLELLAGQPVAIAGARADGLDGLLAGQREFQALAETAHPPDLPSRHAEALSKDAIPPEEIMDFEKHHEPHGYSFSKEGDFNADGKKDRALVGIYKDKFGNTGRFLLILTESSKKRWVKSFLYKSPGRAGFSILARERGYLAWYFCMECDVFSFVKWEHGTYVVVPFECC
ncbi:MAG: hypothetical protein V3V71_18425 [Roseateles sp.]